MSDSPLFEDIKAVDRFSKSLAHRDEVPRQRLAAAERGRRLRPDGTVEDYERIEFQGD